MLTLIKSLFIVYLISLLGVGSALAASSTGTQVVSQGVVAKIDLNQADAVSIAHVVKGIGEKRAAAIVAYREQHGPFARIDDLAQVSGITTTFIETHRAELEEKFTLS